MSRIKRRSWQNSPGGAWSARITWYEGDDYDDVRLELTDCDRTVNLFPRTRRDADHVWFTFRQGAPPDGQRTPFVADLLSLLSSAYPYLSETPEKRTGC